MLTDGLVNINGIWESPIMFMLRILMRRIITPAIRYPRILLSMIICMRVSSMCHHANCFLHLTEVFRHIPIRPEIFM